MQNRWSYALGFSIIAVGMPAFAQTEPQSPSEPQSPAATTAASAAPVADTQQQPQAPATAAPSPVAATTTDPTAAQSQPSASAGPEAPPPRAKVDPGPPTLFNTSRQAISAYGGLSVTGSSMKGRGAAYVGLEAALLFEHRLALGLGGNMLASTVAGPDDKYGDPQRLGFGYGGLIARYSFVSKQPYYLTVGTLVGGGSLGYVRDDWGDRDRYDHDHDRADEWDRKHDTVFVVEPSIGAHLNITRWARIGAQVSYRMVAGVDDVTKMRAKDLSGFAYGGNLQLGYF